MKSNVSTILLDLAIAAVVFALYLFLVLTGNGSGNPFVKPDDWLYLDGSPVRQALALTAVTWIGSVSIRLIGSDFTARD